MTECLLKKADGRRKLKSACRVTRRPTRPTVAAYDVRSNRRIGRPYGAGVCCCHFFVRLTCRAGGALFRVRHSNRHISLALNLTERRSERNISCEAKQ